MGSRAPNVTLDGVVQDPAGDEGFRLGGWVGLIKDRPGVNQLALDDALGAEALLLGRRSYEWFAERWPARTGELADRLNSLPKYVVSSTLEDADWNNSTVLETSLFGDSRESLRWERPVETRGYSDGTACYVRSAGEVRG
jgi:dihydrofolate reductase